MENQNIKTLFDYPTVQEDLICSLVFHSECNSIMNDSERNWGGLCKLGCNV